MSDKFQSARLRLTAWYLLIIMIISILFSAAIFNTATSEIERIIDRIEFHHQYPNDEIPNRPPPHDIQNRPTVGELENTKNRLLFNLIILNGLIFVIAGGGGYFLAGRTLKPIKLMIDEQNQFITSSSHELRTPIATLRSEMEGSLLEKHISDKQARDLIISNLEELGDIQALTNELLQLAHIHNVHDKTNLQNTSIKEIIQTAQKKVLSLARKKQVTIVTNIQEAIVYGQKGRLIELIVILLDNAIKYSHEKTEISIRTESTRNHVKVIITDQGIGIKEKDLLHIFDRFYRADKSHSQTDGFGLGLSIAKIIVETHSGSIHVISKPKLGTSFIIDLPTKNA